MAGESLYQTTSRLQKEVGDSYYNSQRIVRTEAARVMYMAEREAWDKIDIQQLEYLATEGPRTCSSRHLKRYEKGLEPSLPAHPHCRCTYLAVLLDLPEPCKRPEHLKNPWNRDAKMG